MPNTAHIISFNNNLLPVELDALKNKKALYFLRAINHPLRLEMLQLIDKNKQMTVTQIYTELKLQQAVASQHLAVLRRAGFLCTKKESKYVSYMLSYNFINHFSKTINLLFEK